MIINKRSKMSHLGNINYLGNTSPYQNNLNKFATKP